MESCKQVPWSPFSEEESISNKEEENSSCSMEDCNMMRAEECSMCGDVGLPQYLFKCATCSHRYQHIYCSMFYPSRMQETICNWCLPTEQLGNNIQRTNGSRDNMKVSNGIAHTDRNRKPDIVDIATSNPLTNPPKHSKAFEYLLQAAELHGQGHLLDNLECPTTGESNCIPDQFSAKAYVVHDQVNGICSFCEVGHDQVNAKEFTYQRQASLLMMHPIFFGRCRNRSFYTGRGGDKIDCGSGPSKTSAGLLYKHSYSDGQMGHHQIGINLTKNDLAPTQTMTTADHQYQLHDLQVPSVSPVKVHQIGCSAGNDQRPKGPRPDAATTMSKRVCLHKPHVGATGGYHRNTSVDQQKIQSQLAKYNASGDDSDIQQVGESCFSLQGADDRSGHAKRPRHRHAVGIIVSNNDVVSPAARHRAMAGSHDPGHTATVSDPQKVMSNNQSFPTQHAWSRPAGKRDHRMNSPSRAINRRYKLLADVLC